ncbi:hypothetical protein [Streptomyces niveus]|uniref:hypothetical protein n=1 Tax=Streptomyces niveus TaxID=193462 RepID=UPI003414C31F
MFSPSPGLGGAFRRLLFALFTVGLVIGFWRWTGQGVNVTDSGWFSRTTDSVKDFGEFMKDRVNQLADRVG